MPWVVRGGRRYYYASRRDGGRPRTVYLGAGPEASAVAAEVAQRRQGREAAARDRHAEANRVEAAEGLLDELCDGVGLLAKAMLLGAGYWQHDRGEWRLRRVRERSDGEEGHQSGEEGDGGPDVPARDLGAGRQDQRR